MAHDAAAEVPDGRKPYTMERTAHMQGLALSAARVCCKCHTVGEPTAVERCPGCGHKHAMVRLFERATLEALLGMLDPVSVVAEPELPITVRRRAATSEEIRRLVVKAGGDVGEAARLAGCHRNTVTRYVGPKRLWAAVAEAVVERDEVAA